MTCDRIKMVCFFLLIIMGYEGLDNYDIVFLLSLVVSDCSKSILFSFYFHDCPGRWNILKT